MIDQTKQLKDSLEKSEAPVREGLEKHIGKKYE